ncbi:hypothetical protein Afil01_39390 [Actinorhabdospora filicis]|uniref:Uncharacterized protein n=1 Tax=Actinorhabdospora filicis TaxID=1785913 RepID=A0A9W6W4D3_9ACTN|nr:hypothetical protein [Actinorhabdospora filicis]GLZ79132.1 hypothetical protein Afil01_39390 [Actinorhabdospora filicis]
MPHDTASRVPEVAAALEAVIVATRRHLDVIAAETRGDAEVWAAYVALNEASVAYDRLIDEVYGEATPWDPRPLPGGDGEGPWAGGDDLAEPDGQPVIISVRQRRDYLVPSQAALMRIAEAAREAVPDPEDDGSPLTGIGDAVLELLHAGGGTLSALEIEELTPLDGLVVVNEIAASIDLDAVGNGGEDAAFVMGGEQPVVGRLDERSNYDYDDEDEEEEDEGE